MMNREPIIIVGMARSGTTLVSHLLGSLEQVHLEIEPHVLWKAGNFKFLSDSEYDLRPSAVHWIRDALLGAAGEKVLVEKSPVNSLRPHLVKAVFPKARIVYVERNLVRCVNSNLKRSQNRDSFKFSIILRKYLRYTGSYDLEGAIGKRKLHQQLRFFDYPMFALYSLRMIWLRNVRNILPFGPKLADFAGIVARDGLVAYHVQVAAEAARCKGVFQELYGTNFATFRLEKLQTDSAEVRRLYSWCGFEVGDDFIHGMMNTYSKEKVSQAMSHDKADEEIRERLLVAGLHV